MKAAEKFGKKGVKQMLYAVLAALFCFVGPTYFAAIIDRFIPQGYAMALGVVSFVIGIALILKLVKE
ncbi:MAG: hypothetical protein ACLFU9_00280 [Candidatus Bathyarchaeia archaeon]